jgi:hypothetical protein
MSEAAATTRIPMALSAPFDANAQGQVVQMLDLRTRGSQPAHGGVAAPDVACREASVGARSCGVFSGSKGDR